MTKKTIIFVTLILFVMATALCCCTPAFASHSATPSCCHKAASVDKTDQCALSSHPGKGTHTCKCQKITQGVPAQDLKTANSAQSTKHTSSPALTFVIKKTPDNTPLLSLLQGSPPENLIATLYLRNSVLRI